MLTTNLGTTTTYFIGTHQEVTHAGAGQANGVVTKYYYAGAQRIAMRQGTDLYYLIGDHLGSTSIVTDANGTVVSEMRYKAWGEVRHESGASPTEYTYTGQYSYSADFGLMFYNARWYDPSLGRFAQADTIIPSTQGVQAWDRFAYTNNNPVKYTDSTGHFAFLVPILAGAIIGGIVSTSVYIVAAKATGQEVTLAGAAGAFAGGAVAGAVSVIAAPLAGTLLSAAGVTASATALTAGTAGVNAVGGAIAYYAGGYTSNAVNIHQGNEAIFEPTTTGLLTNMAIAGTLSPLAGNQYPVSNNLISSLRQANHFIPGRTIKTIFATQNARNQYAQAFTSAGYGTWLGLTAE